MEDSAFLASMGITTSGPGEEEGGGDDGAGGEEEHQYGSSFGMDQDEDPDSASASSYASASASASASSSSSPRPVRHKKAELTPEGTPAFLFLDATPALFFEEFRCPICLGTMDKTFVTMGCLHRFCCDCLQRALRVDLGDNAHHSCPSCRGKLASRRASNHDSRFDLLMQEIHNAETVAGGTGTTAATAAAGSSGAQQRPTAFNISPRSNKRVEMQIDLEAIRKKHEANVELLRERAKSSHDKFVVATALKGMVQIGLHHVSLSDPARAPKDSSSSSSSYPPRSKRQILMEMVRLPYLKLPPQLSVGDLKSYLAKKLQANWFQAIVTKAQGQLASDLVGGGGGGGGGSIGGRAQAGGAGAAGGGYSVEGEGLAKAHDNVTDMLMPSSAGVALTTTSRRVMLRELYVEALQISIQCRGSLVTCEDTYTLRYICQHIWDRKSPLILYFDAVWKSRLGVEPFPAVDDEDEAEVDDDDGVNDAESWKPTRQQQSLKAVAGAGAEAGAAGWGGGAAAAAPHTTTAAPTRGRPRKSLTASASAFVDYDDYDLDLESDEDERPKKKGKVGRKKKSDNEAAWSGRPTKGRPIGGL